MPTTKYWITEFDGLDGETYVGPTILADTQAFAEALVSTCVRGPHGQTLQIVGELIEQIDMPDHSGVRLRVRPS